YECVATLEGHENEVKSVAWSPSGTLLATCSRDKSVWIWEVVGDNDFECLSVLQEHSQDVKMVQWHPTEEILVSASYDDTLKVWKEDEDDWYCSETLEGHASTVWGVDFDATGELMVSVGDDNSVKLWKRTSSESGSSSNPASDSRFLSWARKEDRKWQCVQTIENHHSRPIYSVSFSRGAKGRRKRIATSSGDNAIKILEEVEPTNPDATPTFKTVAEVHNAHGHSDVNCVRWCPLADVEGEDNQGGGSDLLCSAGDDGVIRIWRY
ncbi:cytosolic iron-sulfur protein assembly, partial [Quaeritorhiza haematococci]